MFYEFQLDFGAVTQNDYEYFHSMCEVWPSGDYTQEFLRTLDPKVAHKAAREIREFVENSYVYGSDLSFYQLQLLRRLENTTVEHLRQLKPDGHKH